MRPSLPPRRRVLASAGAAAIALPALWLGGLARAAQPLAPTPSQSEGPFYPDVMPADADGDLLRNGAAAPYRGGSPAWVEGRVTDLDGKPLAGGVVEIWQCDAEGHYHHPRDGGRADPAFQGFGRVTADADGRWRFRTMKPTPYGGRTPHIHVKVKLGRRDLLTTQLYVAGEPRNARDFLWRGLRTDAERAALTVPFEPGADGARAVFPIAVAA